MNAVHAILRPPARRRGEEGFTLIELLIVVSILGILIAVAIPSYRGFSDRAEMSVAQANVRAVIPAVERFYSDNETYVGLDNTASAPVPGLAHYDPSTTSKVTIASTPGPSQSSYCIYSTTGKATYFKHGPGGDITKDPGPDVTDCNPST